MTREKFNEIKERLAKYREIRHLTYENQQAEFLGNAFEKVSEYFKAKDDLEKVKALCDIALLCFNAFDTNYKEYIVNKTKYFIECDTVSFIDIIESIGSSIVANNELKPIKYKSLSVVNILENISENLTANTGSVKLHKEYNVNYLIYIVGCMCERLHYDFYKCMLETIKEVESYTGHYDDELKKFVKDEGAYTEDEAWILALKNDKNALLEFRPNELIGAPEDTWGFTNVYIKKWYKADYEGCKL
ncbi:hypothetical protein GK500_05305 [Campylobacter lari]|nr:hypothetical protein [Campylobacter lari]